MCRYYPWGGELQFVNADSKHYKFTGKERDSESGLDYFGARYYSNGLSRFMTPDWSATPVPVPYVDLTDPQSLNQYSYVRNIPTVKVDADGHDTGVLEKIAQEVIDAVAKPLIESSAPTVEAAGGISGSAILAGLAVVFGPAMAFPQSVGQSNADERAAMEQAQHEREQQNGGVDPQLGHARGADEEKSQSDDSKDRARTNGGLAKPDKGPGAVPKEQRDPKRTWTRAERQKKLNQQNGKCGRCGEDKTVAETNGHHMKRHADGGKTADTNHAEVCKDCHRELHQ